MMNVTCQYEVERLASQACKSDDSEEVYKPKTKKTLKTVFSKRFGPKF